MYKRQIQLSGYFIALLKLYAPYPVLSTVIVKENETLDSALRRFKRNCAKAGIQQEIRKREHYEKMCIRDSCYILNERKKGGIPG